MGNFLFLHKLLSLLDDMLWVVLLSLVWVWVFDSVANSFVLAMLLLVFDN